MPLTPADGSAEEYLTVLLAREVRDGEVTAIGGHVPLLHRAALLARALHAPRATLLHLGPDAYWPFHGSSKEFLNLDEYGLFDCFLLSPDVVDGHGTPCYPGVDAASQRFPGGIGSLRLLYLGRRCILFVPEHSRQRLVPYVEPMPDTGMPLLPIPPWRGETRLITPLATFDYDAALGGFRLVVLHPGATLDEVQENTGFTFQVAPTLSAPTPPTSRELATLRAMRAEEHPATSARAQGREHGRAH